MPKEIAYIAHITACLILLGVNTTQSAGMAPEQIKSVLNLTKSNWIAYRDYNGRQLIYFTHLEAWKCGIEEVRYNINEGDLDQIWTLSECDPKNPNAVTKEKPYLSFPLGHVKTMQVQLGFPDQSKSTIEVFPAP